ncbi:tetratricopeptide repeat protein [Solidesulfovibrio sp.]|uniref:tetratricopeptide repeat protein n=1 Tax=Solidesulfovibrio sp. TaxID=2910990 RepID=UPI002B1F1FB8|nr:tetratricopeptide repeat protein [Solidesulfovibrio sp.]MEA4856747.1 tetratricopeptide repeat protein [Solidesulfovibrio sp.]
MSTLYITHLLDKLPHVATSRMVHSGIGVWVAWEGQLDAAFDGMLLDYGGFRMADALGQALWFFCGDEGLRALARIHVWGRVNPMPIFIEVFPASLLVGQKFDRTLSISVELSRQHTIPPENLDILIHPALKPQLAGNPGLSSTPVKPASGLARVAFERFEADPGLSYESGLSWLGVLRPLGDPLSRGTAEGWRNIAAELHDIIDRLGLKFQRHEGFLLFEAGGLRVFRTWCRDTVARVMRLKEEGEAGHYWPSVMAVVPSKGRTFGKDLPRRLGLDWDRLTPDFPHMSYRSAFLLGEEFRIHEARALSRGSNIDDWCNVSLVDAGEESQATGSLAVPLPSRLSVTDAKLCFYCGLSNHEPRHCPSKALAGPRPEVWERFGGLSVGGLEELSGKLDAALAADPVGEMTRRVAGREDMDTLLAAIFEIDLPCQLRMLEVVWRSRGKDLPAGQEQLGPREGDYVWDALAALKERNDENYENLMVQALTKYPRAYQPKSLQGFAAMEAGDWVKAVYYWQESGRLCYTALQRAYFLWLQARSLEVQGESHKAIGLYREVLRESPKWAEPVYRQGVCLVKMGFTDQGLQLFGQLLAADPSMFNRVMIDPELERGRLHILSALWRIWRQAQEEAAARVASLGELSESLRERFLADEPYLVESEARVQALAGLGKVGNFVAFKRLEAGVAEIEAAVRKKIEAEVKVMQQAQARQYEDLKSVQREAAWFPFPSLLREFNNDFNFSATKLHWMRTNSLDVPANFHKCREYLPEVDERIRTLRTRLITLRIVRDSTFFCMLLGRNFMWMEVAGLGLSLVLVPLFVYLFQRSGQGWMAQMMDQQKWQLQKGLVIILSIAAVALAAIKTALTFDSKKRKLFQLAEEGKLPVKKPKPRKKPRAKPKAAAKPKA